MGTMGCHTMMCVLNTIVGLPELHTSRTTILPRYSHLRGHASEIFLGSLYWDATWEVHVPSTRLPQVVICISNNKARVGQPGLD